MRWNGVHIQPTKLESPVIFEPHQTATDKYLHAAPIREVDQKHQCETAVLYINICYFISDFRPVANFNYVSSPKFVQSWKVLLMSAACVSKF